MRAFIAIHFTDNIIRSLTNAQDELKIYDKYANYTRRENLHLTLAFIGETDRINDITEIMHSCSVPQFSITVSGHGKFGNLIWAGIEKNDQLEAFAYNLQENLRRNGFDIEKRKFKPHITLAREARIPEGASLSIPRATMTAKSFSLMKSERIKGKIVYTEVACVPLKNPKNT